MPKVSAIVRTRSLRGGHYRAGLRHGAEPGDIPPGTLTEEQLARLQADPDLEVETLDPPQEPPQDPQPRKRKPAAPAGPEAGTAGEPAPDLGAAMTGEGAAKVQAGGDSAEAAGDGEDEDFGFDGDPETPEPGAKGK